MGPISGISSPEALRRAVADGSIDTVIVAFTDHFGRLMGKRFDAEFFCDDALGHGTHGCNYLLTVDMDMEPVEGYAYANWSKGYGDFHLVPDLSTLRLSKGCSYASPTPSRLMHLGSMDPIAYVPGFQTLDAEGVPEK